MSDKNIEIGKSIQELVNKIWQDERYKKPTYNEIYKIANNMTRFYHGLDGKISTTLVDSEQIRKIMLYIDHTENEKRNLKSELETYKKIAKLLAKKILSIHHPMFNMVTINNIDELIEGARKEVEKDE
jgi:hypothetical protein